MLTQTMIYHYLIVPWIAYLLEYLAYHIKYITDTKLKNYIAQLELNKATYTNVRNNLQTTSAIKRTVNKYKIKKKLLYNAKEIYRKSDGRQ